MYKIVLTADILLNIKDICAGSEGKLIIKQDNIGGKDVFLPDNTFGIIDIDKTPNSVTMLYWLIDDESIYFSSKHLKPQVVLLNPMFINNLSILFTDTNAVNLQWTARSGSGLQENVTATRFVIYYSQAAITQENYKFAKRTIVPITPGFSGTIHNYTLGGLEPDSIYFIAIIAEKYQFVTRESPISNIVTSRTNSQIVPETESSYLKLPIDSGMVYVERFYNDEAAGLLDETHALDGNIISLNGIPSAGSDLGKTARWNFTGWKQTWPQENPIRYVIDLKELHRVDYIYIHKQTNTVFNVFTGVFGDDWIFSAQSPATFNQWYRVNIPSIGRECRYIKFEFPTPLNLNEVAIYGSKINKALPKGIKHRHLVPKRSFDSFLGTNTFLNESPSDYLKFGKLNRFYCNWNWMYSPSLDNHNTVVSLTGSNTIPYQFETSRMWNFDQKLQQLHQMGSEMFWCAQTGVNWLLPQNQQGKREFKPLDTHQMPASTNSEDPQSYKFFAQYLFQVAARYGNNAAIDNSLLRLAPEETPKKGLGYLKYIEPWNEPDKDWQDTQGFWSPYQLAAMLSAVYDGHKGALGPGYGIINADPDMKVVMSALTEIKIGYLRFMLHWWDTHRAVGDYPIDVFNFHIYSNTAGGNQTSINRTGLPPELGVYSHHLEEAVEFRNINFPETEIWISETGYDEHPNSRQAPPAFIGDRVIGQIKADWLLRTFLINQMLGIDAVQQYMFTGAGDTLANIKATGFPSVYTTSGYVDFLGSAGNRYNVPDGSGGFLDPRLVSYFYICAFRKELEGMVFSHIIKDKLVKVDGILFDVPDSVYCVAYRPKQGVVKPTCLVIWNATMVEKIQNQIISVNNVATIPVASFRGIEDLKSENAITTNTNTRVDNTFGRVMDLEITETPSIIWTSKIGEPAIAPPRNIKMYSVSTDSIRITWEDVNTGDYLTQIYRSEAPNENFALVSQDYFPDCYYDDSGISGSYYYTVRFAKPDFTQYSQMSDVFGISTLQPLQGITNLRQQVTHVNRLTVAWGFPVINEAGISGFEIFKSLTPTGTYNKIATVSKTIRIYQDIGLLENTTYYYKVRSFSALGYSELSGLLAATTTEEQVQPPLVITANTDFYGNRVFVFFNIPLKNAAFNESHFTVWEGGSSTPIKTINSLSLDTFSQRLVIHLSTPIQNLNNPILVGYDGMGDLASIYDVPLAFFEDKMVTNYKSNQSLIKNKVIVSMNTSNTPQHSPGISDSWNELLFTEPNAPEQKVTANLKNSIGNTTDWIAIAPYVNGVSVWGAATTLPQGTAQPPAGSPFNEKQRHSGRFENGFTSAWGRIAILNVDPNSRYNIKAFASVASGNPDPRLFNGRVQIDNSSTIQINSAFNTSTYFEWNNVAAGNLSLPVEAGGTLPDLNVPKLIMDFRAATAGQGTVLTAVYIEEVIEIIPEI